MQMSRHKFKPAIIKHRKQHSGKSRIIIWYHEYSWKQSIISNHFALQLKTTSKFCCTDCQRPQWNEYKSYKHWLLYGNNIPYLRPDYMKSFLHENISYYHQLMLNIFVETMLFLFFFFVRIAWLIGIYCNMYSIVLICLLND